MPQQRCPGLLGVVLTGLWLTMPPPSYFCNFCSTVCLRRRAPLAKVAITSRMWVTNTVGAHKGAHHTRSGVEVQHAQQGHGMSVQVACHDVMSAVVCCVVIWCCGVR